MRQLSFQDDTNTKLTIIGQSMALNTELRPQNKPQMAPKLHFKQENHQSKSWTFIQWQTTEEEMTEM